MAQCGINRDRIGDTHSFIGPLPSKLHSLKAFFLGEGGYGEYGVCAK